MLSAVVLKKYVLFFGPPGFLAKYWTTAKNRVKVLGGLRPQVFPPRHGQVLVAMGSGSLELRKGICKRFF